MAKMKSTKRAWLVSMLCLLLCFAMLVGTTFAWFTDSVTSGNNIIKSGNLDVEMYWMDGKSDPNADDADWKDASTGTIFDYDLWEPGYTEVRHVKIENVGSLALKYKLNIIPNGEVSELADVIDVYYIDPAKQVTERAALADKNKIGTLSQILNNIASVESTAAGHLLSKDSVTVTIAMKMQESAGNDYQNKAIGSDFAIQLVATQYTHEEDSFGKDYDEKAEYPESEDTEYPKISVKLDDTTSGTSLNQSIKTAAASGKVKNVVYGTWAQWGDTIKGEFSKGNPINTAGTVRSFYDSSSSTVYMLTEQAGTVIAAPNDSSSMFSGMTDLESANLSVLDMSDVTNVTGMFKGCTSLEKVDMSGVELSNVTALTDIFKDCGKLKLVDLSEADLSGLTNLYNGGVSHTTGSAFIIEGSTKSVEIINLSGANLSGVTTLERLFNSNASANIKNVDFSNANLSGVTTMSSMFMNCKGLETVDFSGAALSKVTDVSAMFSQCSSLNNVNLNRVDFSAVIKMDSMFNGSSSLTSVDLSGIETSDKLQTMNFMFAFCSELIKVDISAFKTTVNTANGMFNQCGKIKTIYADPRFKITTSNTLVFGGCTNVEGGQGTTFKTGSSIYARIDGGTANPGYLTAK